VGLLAPHRYVDLPASWRELHRVRQEVPRDLLQAPGVAGDEAEAERTLEGLAAARNYVRHELAERLRLRRPPELYFQIDRADQWMSDQKIKNPAIMASMAAVSAWVTRAPAVR